MNTIRVTPEPGTLLILALVVAPFVLLFFPKTRRLGTVLLGVEGLFVVVSGVFWRTWTSPVPTAGNWPPHHRINRRVMPSPPAPLPQAGEGSNLPGAEIKPSTLPAKKSSTPVWLAMAQAVRRAWAEGPSEPAEKPISTPAAEAKSPLPGWVGRPPHATGDVYQMSITIGPYTTRAECDAKLPEEVQKALNQYIQMCLGERVPASVALPEADFREAIVKDQYEEVRRYSVGPMVNLHVLLELDHAVKQRILEQLRQAAVGRRMWTLGVGMASLLAVLGVFYVYLRVGVRRTPNF
jgi:hypothetical protein